MVGGANLGSLSSFVTQLLAGGDGGRGGGVGDCTCRLWPRVLPSSTPPLAHPTHQSTHLMLPPHPPVRPLAFIRDCGVRSCTSTQNPCHSSIHFSASSSLLASTSLTHLLLFALLFEASFPCSASPHPIVNNFL